jgi:hypothetical protein
MGKTRSMHGGSEEFGLEGLGVDGRTILKWLLDEYLKWIELIQVMVQKRVFVKM